MIDTLSSVLPKAAFTTDRLLTRIYASREAMGAAAAAEVADHLRALLRKQTAVRMIFAAAPSQNELLAHLRCQSDIAWERVEAFHMDEYEGLEPGDPRSFRTYLEQAIADHLPFKVFHWISDLSYGERVGEAPIDVVLMGIGENGHIAFNDPPFARFDDQELLRSVELEERCRCQQVNDGCFASLDDVPTHALTLTIPALMHAGAIFCVVPGPTKTEALRATLTGPIAEACPASILRRHPAARLYTDEAAASSILSLL